MSDDHRPRIVIVGAGFGGLFATKALAKAPADVTLIDRHNYHLFQPLLYQVATAALAPSDIAWPIRSVLTRQRNASVLLGEVHRVDVDKRQVEFDGGQVEFDYLVLATGTRHSYFGHDAWSADAPGLKSIDDATAMRRRLLLAFERAETCSDADERQRLLRFVIVGAGPTGVELASGIAELAHFTLAADFRRIDPRSARVTLVEAGPRVLPTFDDALSEYAQAALERLHVEVRVNAPVTHCDNTGIRIGDERIAAATTLWAAGVAASPVGEWLGVPTDRAGRVSVSPDLSIDGAPNVFVIGDAAAVTDRRGVQVPGIAPAAKQQGRYVARRDHRTNQRPRGHHRPSAMRTPATWPRLVASRLSSSCPSLTPEGPAGLVDVGRGAHLLPDRSTEPADGVVPLAVGVLHVWAWCPVDHGREPRRDRG